MKVNFSKSGASLSLGGRGHSVNIGSRGTRTTFGIPGTGLSYSTKVGGGNHSRKASSPKSSSRSSVIVPNEIRISMNDKGKVVISDVSGNEITNQAILKRIKATAQYQNQIAQLEILRREKNDEMVRDSEEENQRFINIYKLSSTVDSYSDFEERLNNLKPVEYVEQEFDALPPTKERIREFLTKEAETEVKGPFFKIGKLRKQYVEENLQQRFDDAFSAWESEKEEFYAFQTEEKKIADEAAFEDCENQKAFLKGLISGDDKAVGEIFDSWIESCELPVEINIDYDWNNQTGIMMLDVDLPEIEDINATKLLKLDNGNIKEKKKTQTELRAEYATLVFGLAIFITTHTLNVSPAIKKVLISGYTQRSDRNGNINDDYIYSIKFLRDMFEHKDLLLVEPKEFCMTFENRCNMTSTSLFKTIKPYDEF